MMAYIKGWSQPIVWRLYKWYLSVPRWYHYQGIQIRLLPTVFHPGWLISTKVLLRFISTKSVYDKKVLELGAGSGLLSFYAASQGAISTATDINPMAIQAMRESVIKNNLPIRIIYSNLFENILLDEFDFIFINPPFFPKDPRDDWERAFYCGSNFEYFHLLFKQISPYLSKHTEVYMILNDSDYLGFIKSLALEHALELAFVSRNSLVGEELILFILQKV